MTVYSSDQQLYSCFKALFTKIGEVDPTAADELLKSKMSIRFQCTEPKANIVIDGRQRPLQIEYGRSNVKPQLDIALSGDTLHEILLGTLRLTKAMGSKRIKPKGPIWKAKALESILHHAQALYPAVIQECNPNAAN